MRTLHEVGEVRKAVRRKEGRCIGLVPTMGFLHDGHLSLIRKARVDCDLLIVSIYVNPMQFGPHEDLAHYPRDLARDSALCLEQGVDFLFVPDDAAMYPPGFCTRVSVAGVTEGLCSAFRPGHFDGVATVVAKLLAIIQPSRAYFGEKDYQQLVAVRRMVQDLNHNVEIVACPTVRESDGLAMSSRNVRLSPEQRAAAPALYQALCQARQLVEQGAHDPAALARATRAAIEQANGGFRVEYCEVRDAESLSPVAMVDRPVVIAVAAHLGDVRLIDNIVVRPAGQAA